MDDSVLHLTFQESLRLSGPVSSRNGGINNNTPNTRRGPVQVSVDYYKDYDPEPGSERDPVLVEVVPAELKPGRKLKYDGFDNLRECLDEKRYIRSKFEDKMNPDDERCCGSGLEALMTASDPLPLSRSANRQFEKPDLPMRGEYERKPADERNYREDKPVAFKSDVRGGGDAEAMTPVLYRVAEILDDMLLCESVFAFGSLAEEGLQYVVIEQHSLEAPDFEYCGFNVQFVDVNDMVWIYDICGFDDSALQEHATFARAMYGGTKRVYWSSRAHGFTRTTEFLTSYGYVINSNGDAVITGSDEIVRLSSTKMVDLYGTPANGEVFRLDYITDVNLNVLKKLVDPEKALIAGFSMILKPARRDKEIVVIAATIHTNDLAKMTDPFKQSSHLMEAIEMQTRGFTIAKFTDAVLQQVDADSVMIPATILWQNENCGKLVVKGGRDADNNLNAFAGAKLATIVIPRISTILVKLEVNKMSSKKNLCLHFTTFPADRPDIMSKIKEIKKTAEVNVSPVEQNPTDDVFLRYLFSGTMRRQFKSHIRDRGPMNRNILHAMRNGQFHEIYDFDDSAINRKPFTYCDRPLVLDEEQSVAVEFVAKCNPRPASVVVQACAGAGKTLCSVALMVETMKMDKNAVQFMCAPTNRAVDNMAFALSHNPEARPIRLFSKAALEKFEKREPKYSYKSVVQSLDEDHKKYGVTASERTIVEGYLRLCRHLDNEGSDVTHMGQGTYYNLLDLKRRAESAVNHILVARYKPNVILTTVDMGIRDMLSNLRSSICKLKFNRILIDESSQLDEPKFNAILSLNMRTEQVVLVGDPKQLPPYMALDIPDVLRQTGGQSALDAMMTIDNMPIVQLQIGYRMHNALLALTSAAFYDSSLVAAKEGPWKAKERKWNRFDPECPIIIGFTGGKENQAGGSRSTSNELEAKLAEKLVREAISQGVAQKDIGVICLYNAQVRALCRRLSDTVVEISSVDSFQGREKDYIIVLTSKSVSQHYTRSFYSDMRRSNVATSRAILGMIILGEEEVMKNSRPWQKITEFARYYQLTRDNFAAELKVSV